MKLLCLATAAAPRETAPFPRITVLLINYGEITRRGLHTAVNYLRTDRVNARAAQRSQHTSHLQLVSRSGLSPASPPPLGKLC